MRSLERLLCMSQEKPSVPLPSLSPPLRLVSPSPTGSEEYSASIESGHVEREIEIEKEKEREKESERREYECVMPVKELGLLMSILYRIQNILVLNSSHFEDITLRFLQVGEYIRYECNRTDSIL